MTNMCGSFVCILVGSLLDLWSQSDVVHYHQMNGGCQCQQCNNAAGADDAADQDVAGAEGSGSAFSYIKIN